MVHRGMVAALAVGIVVVGGLMAWWLRAPLVAAVTLQPTTLVRTLQCSARVAAASRVDVGSTLTGRVLDVAVIEGAPVKQGDVLLRLQSDEWHAAWMQAQASERQAAARLAGLRGTGRSSAQAALSQADSVLIAAQAELQRTRVLVDQGFLSAARLDEVERSVAVATAQQAGALALRAATAEQGTDTQQAQAQLSLATAATAAALARLNQTVLTAPADAHVLARWVEPGQIVQPGRGLLTLALTGPTQLIAQADERFLEQLQEGQSALVVADAFPGQRLKAQVQSIAPLVDAQRGAVVVKFSLTQPAPAFLREDMTLSVEVETARRDPALAVPISALRSAPGVMPTLVWIERGGRVEQRMVRLGLRTLDAAEVLEGLTGGDTVLLGPSPTPGRRVRVDGTAAVAAAGKPAREDAGAAMSNAMGR
jgi:HlyD family secretion protein